MGLDNVSDRREVRTRGAAAGCIRLTDRLGRFIAVVLSFFAGTNGKGNGQQQRGPFKASEHKQNFKDVG